MSDNLTDIWEDRRVRIGYETAEELALCYNRDNWRAHPENQRAATEDSLDTLGLIGQIKKSTVNNLMFDGHLRVELALAKNPQMLLPVDYYDLNDDETALALTIHDAITEQAGPILDKLAALLERTRALTADRPGLGAMLQALKLRAGMNGQAIDPMAEWQGMPEFEQEDLTAYQSIHVHFKNREDVNYFAELIGQKLTEYTRSIWYPEAEKTDMKNRRYQNES